MNEGKSVDFAVPYLVKGCGDCDVSSGSRLCIKVKWVIHRKGMVYFCGAMAGHSQCMESGCNGSITSVVSVSHLSSGYIMISTSFVS